MSIKRWVIIILAFLFILTATAVTPLAWLGIIIYVFGVYQMYQRSKGKVTFSKPGWIVGAGIILTFIIAFTFVEPTEETAKDTDTVKQEEKIADESSSATKKEPTEEELAEAKRLEEEQKAQEEAERLVAEQKAKDEADRLAEEQRKKDEEAQRLAEELRQKEEVARLAEEQRQKEEEKRLAEEQAQAAKPVTVQTESFKNCTELRKVYPSGVPAGHPAYQSKMDRDKDNYACER